VLKEDTEMYKRPNTKGSWISFPTKDVKTYDHVKNVVSGVFRGGAIGGWPPFGRTGRFFALKNIDELSLIDGSFNWLNLATYPKLNSDMKCTAVTARGACSKTYVRYN
jgi:hypothetical protein